MLSLKMKHFIRDALSAMVSLAMEKDFTTRFLEESALQAVAIVLCNHYHEPDIAKLAFNIMSSIVSENTEAALSLLLIPKENLPNDEIGILDITILAYRLHCDHGSVVEGCAGFLASLTYHADLVSELNCTEKAVETIEEIARRYRDRETITNSCKFILDAMKNGEKLIENEA